MCSESGRVAGGQPLWHAGAATRQQERAVPGEMTVQGLAGNKRAQEARLWLTLAARQVGGDGSKGADG